MTRMPMPEELEALKNALSDALGELRVVRTERDLLKKQFNRFTHRNPDNLLGAVFPATTLQTCIVHLIRNSLDYASWKDRRLLTAGRWPAACLHGPPAPRPQNRR